MDIAQSASGGAIGAPTVELANRYLARARKARKACTSFLRRLLLPTNGSTTTLGHQTLGQQTFLGRMLHGMMKFRGSVMLLHQQLCLATKEEKTTNMMLWKSLDWTYAR